MSSQTRAKPIEREWSAVRPWRVVISKEGCDVASLSFSLLDTIKMLCIIVALVFSVLAVVKFISFGAGSGWE